MLIAEREKYNANDVKPGLTGWAQINGRDELEIPVKAKLDGEYVEKLGIWMDIKCFLGTIGSVLNSDGVVEGGTGEMNKAGMETDRSVSPEKMNEQIKIGAIVIGVASAIATGILVFLVKAIKFQKESKKIDKKKSILKRVVIFLGVSEIFATIFINVKRRVKMSDYFVKDSSEEQDIELDIIKQENCKKKILITGKGSYIGESVEQWLLKDRDQYEVDTLDMLNNSWRDKDFAEYDVIFHVAGIAHADVGAITEEQKELYYEVNTELTLEVAEKAKRSNVKQFMEWRKNCTNSVDCERK
ncbi:sugar transferase [Mediterraneibacter gnavus]|uniref:sugar transferase n=1 Tax=Mediterraneibacter gnavus TaxID=33038 RepID=UPI001FA90901